MGSKGNKVDYFPSLDSVPLAKIGKNTIRVEIRATTFDDMPWRLGEVQWTWRRRFNRTVEVFDTVAGTSYKAVLVLKTGQVLSEQGDLRLRSLALEALNRLHNGK